MYEKFIMLFVIITMHSLKGRTLRQEHSYTCNLHLCNKKWYWWGCIGYKKKNNKEPELMSQFLWRLNYPTF